ncbi:MAG TPA: S8 family peptidase [Pantanalinema sp.]
MTLIRKPVALASVLAAMTALSLTGCGMSTGAAIGNTGSNAAINAESVPSQVLVKFKTGAQSLGLTRDLGAKTVRSNSKIGMQLITVKGDVATAISKLKASGMVEYAEPNYVVRASDYTVQAEVNDPMAKDQYTLDKVQARQAWDLSMGSSKTVLAIVDTGVDHTHPDLAGRVLKGHDFVNNDDDAMDDQGHGTHCAGIAAASANNSVGIAGIAPKVTILAVKVLSKSGSGSYEGVAQGIVYAADQGAQVISMSLGGPTSSQAVEDAVKYAMSKGTVVVAAMGNDGRETKSYPAAIPGVIGVGSTDAADQKSNFSNMGSHISISAPGSNILSTLPMAANPIGKTQYGSLSGTSMACPAAAGLAALVRDKYPSLDINGVRAKLEQSAQDLGTAGFDKSFGHGRINAFKALSI